MLFNSVEYAAFLAVTVTAYWYGAPAFAAGSGFEVRRVRQWLLLVASYAFYASWDWRYCFVLAASTGVNFLIARRLAVTDHPERRRLLLAASCVWGLGILAFFKYTDFLVDSVADLLGVFGVDASPATLGLTVPWGISFFTFHTLSYVIDVYRRELEPTDDPVVFAVFVAYFPQLLAGPLTRGRRMLPQVQRPPERPDVQRWQEGGELLLLGLFQKVAVADALAPMTSAMFSAHTAATPDRNWLMLCIAAASSVIQFVLDFAGYSNMARGASKLLGIDLPYNFRQPITRSRDFQDYWRRHHLSLMAWFRDYVLRPLRRRNDSRLRSSLLLVGVFTLSGLWHGAAWTWLVWGLAVGGAVALEVEVKRRLDAARRVRPTANTSDDQEQGLAELAVHDALGRTVRSAYVLALMAAGIVLIRSATLSDAGAYYGEILAFASPPFDWDSFGLFLYALVALVLVDRREHRLEEAEGTHDPVNATRAVGWGAMVVAIVVFSGTTAQPFVYFQF